MSFASQHEGCQVGEIIDLDGLDQVVWPDHCVQHSHGAEFAAGLHLDGIAEIFCNGTNRQRDSYSGFYDNGALHSTGLGRYLQSTGVDEVSVMGLATDYCVRATALDAAGLGFRTRLIADACRGVEGRAGDCERAIAEMSRAGATISEYASIFDV